jgi:hypothetical protein
LSQIAVAVGEHYEMVEIPLLNGLALFYGGFGLNDYPSYFRIFSLKNFFFDLFCSYFTYLLFSYEFLFPAKIWESAEPPLVMTTRSECPRGLP